MPETFVIVGASLTGGGAAATLRQEGFDGRMLRSWLVGLVSHPRAVT
jgi:hypothetical protein